MEAAILPTILSSKQRHCESYHVVDNMVILNHSGCRNGNKLVMKSEPPTPASSPLATDHSDTHMVFSDGADI